MPVRVAAAISGFLVSGDPSARLALVLGIPAFSGAMIGHVNRQFTLPLGVQVELDADAGTITMLESAVV